MSLPEIIAHGDACKRSEIIVVIAMVFPFFSISHHHRHHHHNPSSPPRKSSLFLPQIHPFTLDHNCVDVTKLSVSPVSGVAHLLSAWLFRKCQVALKHWCYHLHASSWVFGRRSLFAASCCFVRALLLFCFIFFAHRFQEKFGSADELVTALFASQMGMARWQRPGRAKMVHFA